MADREQPDVPWHLVPPAESGLVLAVASNGQTKVIPKERADRLRAQGWTIVTKEPPDSFAPAVGGISDEELRESGEEDVSLGSGDFLPEEAVSREPASSTPAPMEEEKSPGGLGKKKAPAKKKKIRGEARFIEGDPFGRRGGPKKGKGPEGRGGA